MRPVVLLVLFAIPTNSLAAQLPPSQEEEDAAKPARLYRSHEPFSITLRADFRTAFKDRDTTRVDTIPATLQWIEDGDSMTVALGITTRGHFRLRGSTCSFPPLRLLFPEGATKGGVFRGDRTLKLVTHCQGRDNYEQQLLREYLAYRLFNVLTDMSFRVRLAQATYVDAKGEEETHWGFFLEDDDDMARRNGGQLLDVQGIQIPDAQSDYMGLVGLFAYMIGNTDFSVPFLHNIRVVMVGEQYFPVPYDLDWAGLVDARYARPDARLPIKTVRDRLYRGGCLQTPDLVRTTALFNQKRDEIEALLASVPGLDERSQKWCREYLGKFYDIINDAPKARRELQGFCN